MSCKKIEKPQGKVHQLIQQTKSSVGNREDNVFPITLTQAVVDGCTGEPLHHALSIHNHLYLRYKGHLSHTFSEVPVKYRRKGLYVTFTDATGAIRTFRYKEQSLSKEVWSKVCSWEEVFISEHTGIKDIRFTDCTLEIELENSRGETVKVLRAELPYKKPFLKPKIVEYLPVKGESDTIYLLPNLKYKGTYNEWIWVEEAGIYSQLGSAVCNMLSEGGSTAIKLIDLEQVVEAIKEDLEKTKGTITTYDDAELKERVTKLEQNPVVQPYDDTDLKQRVKALEQKTDNDTIYNDSDVVRRLTELEGKVDKDTVFDPTSLNNKDAELEGRINDLQSKVNSLPTSQAPAYNDKELRDKITALEQRPSSSPYDDTSIKQRVSALEAKPSAPAYNDTEVKRRLDALESKPDKDTMYDDSVVKQRLTALESKPAGELPIKIVTQAEYTNLVTTNAVNANIVYFIRG